MIKYLFSTLAAVMLVALGASAQIVTTSPAILQEASQNVSITFHADAPQGNDGLKGVTASDPVYAHTGVITNKSNSQWKNAPSWGDNAAKYKLEYVSANTWRLDLGNIRTYYGITDPSEKIERLCFVFRNGACNKEGKTKSGGDIFVDVFPEGFQMLFSTNAASTVISSATSMNFEVHTSQAAAIEITVNGTSIKKASNATDVTATHRFASTGSYKVVATATAGGQTITKTINIAYPGASTAGTYPGGVPRQGAVENADGTVTFCLAAPGKKSAVLVPSWDDYEVLDKNIMKYQDYQGQRYFFTTVSGLPKDTDLPYYYIVDAKYKVADPYARLVLDCYSDKWLDSGIWPDMPKYPYEKFDDTMLAVYRSGFDKQYDFSNFTIPSHDNLVIYELLVRDFTGTEGKANAEGTLRKAIDKIDYLAGLGVNAIELMPVMEFNGNNSWGYNTNFYFAPDKAYGSPTDLMDFVETCHRHGIAVILDVVFNHSDGLHPWYQMYDIASNPFYNQNAPHSYGVLNDWKQENALVKQQWKDALQMWLTTYNVDGFRFDLVKGLGTSFPNGTDGYCQSRIDLMKELHAAMKAVKPNAIHINENLAQTPEENAMAADGQLNWANVNKQSCQFAMGYASDSDLQRYLSTKDGDRTAFSTVAYAESHDEERMGYKQTAFGPDGIKGDKAKKARRLGQVATQLLLTPGPKMIWQFGELAADQTTKDGDNNNTDPKTVIWNNLNDSDIKALHDTYQALCWLRRDNPELFARDAEFVTIGFANSLTSNRIMRLKAGNKEVMAFINPAINGANKTVGGASTLLNANNCQLICASPGFTPALKGSGTSVSVSVPANGYAVFATKSTTEVDDLIPDNGAEGLSPKYYNLQGVAVDGENLAPGVYIEVRGDKSTKVMIR